MKTLKG